MYTQALPNLNRQWAYEVEYEVWRRSGDLTKENRSDFRGQMNENI